jgi:hypothetical protein
MLANLLFCGLKKAKAKMGQRFISACRIPVNDE